MAIRIGEKIWVRIGRKDQWVPGILTGISGLRRQVIISATNQKKTVSFSRVSRWGNERIQIKELSKPPYINCVVVPNMEMAGKPQLQDWLKKLKTELGVSIPMRCYANKKQRLTLVAALLPREAITDKSMSSWREMALIGDALWRSYLRIVFIRRGYRNGRVTTSVGERQLESRKKLGMVEQRLDLNSLLPILSGILHGGEVAEAFLGWAYTFGGEKSYLRLAQKYLEILE